MRIHILGGPGSGKTTLARYLAARLDLPHYDLDRIGWNREYEMADYIEDARAIAERARWVAEGIHLIWTDPLLYRADHIVLLESSWPVAAWRILRRHATRSVRGTNPYPGVNGLRLLYKLLAFSRHYYTDKLDADMIPSKAMRRCLGDDRKSGESPDVATVLERAEICKDEVPFTREFVRLYLRKHKEKVQVIKSSEDRKRLLALLMQASKAKLPM